MKALIRVTGAVQGVGYRPFVAKLSYEYKLKGEVKNVGGIVEILAEADRDVIYSFADRLRTDCPPGSIILDISVYELNENGKPEGPCDHSGFHAVKEKYSDFRIVKSGKENRINGLYVFPPDIGICAECSRELLDEDDRRYRYPLISCASCGPRYSILNSIPYDRETTTMESFKMCPKCEAEYAAGRRMHAQTISCHDCGPQVSFSFCNASNNSKEAEDYLKCASDIIKNGGIIGIKGVGGYQLAADPYNEKAVERLRLIKGREQKPFAVMFESAEQIENYCHVSKTEREYLQSLARPIVLLDKKSDIKNDFAYNVSMDSRQIGAFLPSSGIHELLIRETGALIVTSGNYSSQPMIIDDNEYAEVFAGKIDGIITYDRQILRPLDDSVMQVIRLSDGREVPRFIRRSRGYVPLPLLLSKDMADNTLYYAFGADLKNTFSIGYRDKIISSQYLGDMESLEILMLQKKELDHSSELFDISKIVSDNSLGVEVISDMHPAYHSADLAKSYFEHLPYEKKTISKIQHHHAHIGSVMAENGLTECIGVAFDGTGYGTDNTIWGAEFLVCRGADFERAAHFKAIKMVGQDESMKDAAIGAVCFLKDAGLDIPDHILDVKNKKLILAAIDNNISVHRNSGMGRLFDAVSCILGFSSYNNYEGECAVKLQNAAESYLERCIEKGESPDDTVIDSVIEKDENNSYVISQADIVSFLFRNGINADIETKEKLAYVFHNSLSKIILDVCCKIRSETGLNSVSLSGGVFTNRLLFAKTVACLEENGFVVYYNRIYPTNDGGISPGQIYLRSLTKKDQSRL
ncbi:MAG: carbamoyltransferase HypF [Butyrivibrio sp.]|nr:carbamoyltransferase HypF [Butyrivibrio sp.]